MRAIAIDGPSGAGKSTMARKLAKELGYIYVDTGALYRAVGYHVLSKGKDPKNEEEVAPLLSTAEISLSYRGGEQCVILNGCDISQNIRTPEVSMAASDVSAHKTVREFLLSLQKDMARTHNVVMDGRDIGTVILPQADVKIFLTASPEDRARRRYLELCHKGMEVKQEDVLREMIERDQNDSGRKIAPLRPAEDAIRLDTTGNTVEQSVEIIIKLVKERLKNVL